jgi:hypothetical protein
MAWLYCRALSRTGFHRHADDRRQRIELAAFDQEGLAGITI